MKVTVRLAVAFLCLGCFLIWTSEAVNLAIVRQEREALDYNRTIKPDLYRTLIGQGFATNWFKEIHPARKYKKQNVIDVFNAGFRNLRLRSRADLYPYPFDTSNFTTFLDKLEEVVDDCLETGVYPIISWIHHCAEAFATEEDKRNYITWWTKVSTRLQKKDYRLAFNLFTELGVDTCSKTKVNECHSPLAGDCSESLREHASKYNEWTSAAVKAIRGTGGKNRRRILILGAPTKTAKSMEKVDTTILDKFMMMEWHIYASGPTHQPGSPKFWSGHGTAAQRQTLLDQINLARHTISLESYYGAWMPTDNLKGTLHQSEVENFAKFFCSTMKQYGIPWSMNVLDRYYDTAAAKWIITEQDVGGQRLNMSKVLDVIKENM